MGIKLVTVGGNESESKEHCFQEPARDQRTESSGIEIIPLGKLVSMSFVHLTVQW
jgi:hypothetical protein